jgi:hypothetical protein
MFAVLVVAGGIAVGFPVRDRRPDVPPALPMCASGDCNSPQRWEPSRPSSAPQQTTPLRECPEGTSMTTVRPGYRYCVPDRPIRDSRS